MEYEGMIRAAAVGVLCAIAADAAIPNGSGKRLAFSISLLTAIIIAPSPGG